MSLLSNSLFRVNFNNNVLISIRLCSSVSVTQERSIRNPSKPEFKRLDLITKDGRPSTKRAQRKKGVFKTELMPDRSKQMPTDQSWMSVWPTAQMFRPSVVPLPIRQGFDERKPPYEKHGNPELMKIPNFLHLTPPAIKAHCAAIKKFCTPWPDALDSDKTCESHFPLEKISSDYLYSGPSSKDERARVVTIKVKVSDLKLDYHGRDKFLRLIGEKYDPKKDILTIAADRCPLRKQNYDYAIYVLNALYHESQKTEEWESGKAEEDMEVYFFEGSRAQKKVFKVMEARNIEGKDIAKEYGESLEILYNKGENEESLKEYKEAALKVLGFHDNGTGRNEKEEGRIERSKEFMFLV